MGELRNGSARADGASGFRSGARLDIEAPDADTALALIHALDRVHAELSPLDRDRCLVTVDLGRRPATERLLARVLDAVDGWLLDHEIASTSVRVGESKKWVLTCEGARAAKQHASERAWDS